MGLSNFYNFFGKSFFQFRKKRTKSTHGYSSWVIYLTGKCSLACSYCYAWKRLGFDMPKNILVDAMNFLKRQNTNQLKLWGGEPLEYPDGVKYVLNNSRVRSYSITTNGIHLTQELFEELRRHRVGIALSFDGTRTSQDEGRNKSYDLVMKHIDKWLDLIRKNGGQILKTVNNPENLYADIKHIYELGFPRCFINFYRAYGTSYSSEEIRKLEKEYTRTISDFHFLKGFTLTDVNRYQFLWNRYQSTRYTPSCGINLQGKAIGPDGRIYPCESAPLMGKEFSIGDIWNGIDPKKSEKIRRRVSRLPKRCENCDLKCFPCPVCSWINKKEIGSDPEDWFCELKKMQFRVVNRFSKKCSQ